MKKPLPHIGRKHGKNLFNTIPLIAEIAREIALAEGAEAAEDFLKKVQEMIDYAEGPHE
jgi:hypothetical protein